MYKITAVNFNYLHTTSLANHSMQDVNLKWTPPQPYLHRMKMQLRSTSRYKLFMKITDHLSFIVSPTLLLIFVIKSQLAHNFTVIVSSACVDALSRPYAW